MKTATTNTIIITICTFITTITSKYAALATMIPTRAEWRYIFFIVLLYMIGSSRDRQSSERSLWSLHWWRRHSWHRCAQGTAVLLLCSVLLCSVYVLFCPCLICYMTSVTMTKTYSSSITLTMNATLLMIATVNVTVTLAATDLLGHRFGSQSGLRRQTSSVGLGTLGRRRR